MSDFHVKSSFRFFNNFNNQTQSWRQLDNYQQDDDNQQFQRVYYDDETTNENKDVDIDYHDDETYDNEYSEDSYHDQDYVDSNIENFNYEYHDQQDTKIKAFENQEVNFFFLQTFVSRITIFRCKRCDDIFQFNNKLHKHIRGCKISTKKITVTTYHDISAEMIISDASKENSQGLEFKSWHYATVKESIKQIENDEELNLFEHVETSLEMSENDLISNIDCIMFIVDKQFLHERISSSIIKHTSSSVKVRDIENVVLSFSKYVTIEISMRDILNKTLVVDKIRRQLHIVDNLKINIFMRSNILSLEKMIVNYDRELLTIECCKNMKMFMTITSNERVKRAIRAHHSIIIFARFSIMISVRLRDHSKLFHDRDLMFTSYSQTFDRFDSKDEICSHIIDVNMCVVQVNNAIDRAILISRNSRLSIIQNYEKKECYVASADHDFLAVDFNWTQKIFRLDVFALAAFEASSSKKSSTSSTQALHNSIEALAILFEHTTSIGIIVYDNIEIEDQLIAIANSYSLL